MKETANYIKKLGLLLCAVTALSLHTSSVSQAKGLAADNAFDNASFNQIMEIPAQGSGNGAICSTDNYIINIEDTSDDKDSDTVSAYYKNTVDENGQEVEQYSLAKQVTNYDYGQPSGITYNPKTNELIVAGYSSGATDSEGSSEDTEANKGVLYIIDAETLEYKNTIDVSKYSIIGVAYDEHNDRYVVQADTNGEYNYKLLDSGFKITDELGEMNEDTEGTGYHGLYVSSDYFLNFPITSSNGTEDYIHMYSITKKAQVSSTLIQLSADSDVTSEVPVAIFETSPGEFIVASSVTKSSDEKAWQLFSTTSVSYEFQITTSGTNGTVSEGSDSILRGDDFTLALTPDEGYSLSSLMINGENTDTKPDWTEYVLQDVQSDYTVEAVFEKGDGVTNTKDSQNNKSQPSGTDSKISSSSMKLLILAIVIAVLLIGIILYRNRINKLRAEKSRQRKNEIYMQQHEYLDNLDLDDIPSPDEAADEDDDIEIIEENYTPDEEESHDENPEILAEEPDSSDEELDISDKENDEVKDEEHSSSDGEQDIPEQKGDIKE